MCVKCHSLETVYLRGRGGDFVYCCHNFKKLIDVSKSCALARTAVLAHSQLDSGL